MSADPIDAAVAGLGGLPGAVVGRGPRHPYEPEEAPAEEIAEFLGAHPVLVRDRGYVAFLERYAHACVKDDAPETMIIDLLGFGAAETHMNEMDGAVVDDEGYLMFAQCLYFDVRDGALVDSDDHAFAFHVEGDRPWAVYRLHSTLRRPEGNAWAPYAPDFTTWLARLVAAGGRLGRP